MKMKSSEKNLIKRFKAKCRVCFKISTISRLINSKTNLDLNAQFVEIILPPKINSSSTIADMIASTKLVSINWSNLRKITATNPFAQFADQRSTILDRSPVKLTN